MTKPRLIVGISGASGVALGVRALEMAAEAGVETHLVMTKAAEMTIGYELDRNPRDVAALATVAHALQDVGASIASGSFRTVGMLIAPCSMRTLSEIAYGMTTTLLTRAADVALKERRRLVLMARETPLHTGHLRAMTQASEIGAIVMPPVPAFYAEPKTIDDVVDQLAARALDQFDIDVPPMKRWGEDLSKGRRRGS